MQHAALRHGQLRHAERVDEHDVGQRRQRENGALHGAQRRLMDVDAIDFRGVAPGDGPGDGAGDDFVVERRALGRRDGLRIGETGNMPVRVRTTAAATTGPARQPRPTSSVPAT